MMNRLKTLEGVRRFATVGAIMGLSLLIACASTGAKRSVIDLAVTPDGVVLLDNKPVLLKRLPKALKAEGATRETGIYVAVPDQASPQLLRELTATLATAGYPRVMFRKPEKAITVVE